MSMRVTELRPTGSADRAADPDPKVRVMHVRPDAALSHTVQAPVFFADEAGNMYEIDEWSLEGVVWPEIFPPEKITGQLCLNFQGFNISFPTTLKSGATEGEMVFAALDRRQHELLREFYRSIQSGRMTAAEDLILSMDTPVAFVPMEQTAEDLAHEPARAGRFARGLVSMGFTVLLAIAVLGSLGYVIWQQVNYVGTSDARISQTGPVAEAEAWVADDDLLRTWVGMTASVELNVDGRPVLLPAQVTALAADAGLLPREDNGILATVAIDPAALEGVRLEPGQPARVRLDRDLETALWAWRPS